MKAGLTTSLLAHAAILGFCLFSLSAPRPLEVADVEAMPVDIVPIEEVTKIQEGDKTSAVKERPAPKPTTKPAIVPEATKTGDNSVDTDKPPIPDPSPKPVEQTAAPPPAPEPAPRPLDKPKQEAVKPPPPKPVQVAEAEPAPQEKPKQEVKPDPIEQAIAAESPDAESVQLPNAAPAPEAKPQPPKAEAATAPDKKDAEKPAQDAAAKPKSTEKQFNADEITALLNKEKPSGGGAKRSTQQASLGGEKPNGGSKLSQSEMDALRGQVEKCWNIPAGAQDGAKLRVSVKFKLDRTGALDGEPQVISGGGDSGVERAAAEAARRAVSRCSPYTLPADKYEAWADVIVNFDPSDMF